ncbi:MAG: AmmeMemoRadiSam system radical SAM enzyme [Bacillota bacterium]|nr:AmmeMemoRadiSam system radical SAM enzyme [Bacillota bacterium]
MKTICQLCFHHCRLEEGEIGFCGARIGKQDKVRSLNYGKVTALALDPIEKKPLRRFHSGSMILSVGSFGCNLRCPFCQNHSISMAGREGEEPLDRRQVVLSPEELAERAKELEDRGNLGIAYTYNEPLVGYEFVLDAAEMVRRQGLLNVLVTNGTVNGSYWRQLLPLIDAANIDLKGFSQEWYGRLGGDLECVKRNIVLAAEACHLEVTTLLIPGENDSREEIEALSRWLAAVDRNIPLHLSRFFPQYRMTDRPPTPVDRIHELAEVAGEHLNYVYRGNC